MQSSVEQRMAIKFCVKLGKSAAETVPLIKTAFKEDALSDRQVFRWHKVFLKGREEVDDKARSGRPSTRTTASNVTRVKDLLNTDRRLSIRLLSQLLDIPKTSVHEIVAYNLKMRKVPRKLNPSPPESPVDLTHMSHSLEMKEPSMSSTHSHSSIDLHNLGIPSENLASSRLSLASSSSDNVTEDNANILQVPCQSSEEEEEPETILGCP